MKTSIITLAVVLSLLHSKGFSQSLLQFNAETNSTLWTENHTGTVGSERGYFVGSSGTSMGNAWGLYANTGQTASLLYNFSTLQVGGYVQIDLSLGWMDNGAVVGLSLRNSSGVNRFETFYRGNDTTDAFKIIDSAAERNVTGVNTSFGSSSWKSGTPDFQTIRFTLGSGNSYQVSFDGANATNSSLTVAASDISQVRIFNYNAGTTGDKNQYFDNLTISVPEPSSASLIMMGAAGLLALRRRRNA